MKKIIKILAIGLITVTLIGLFTFIYLINTHVDIKKYEAWTVTPSLNPPPASVKVQFVGVSTLVISDDSTTIMTDGFFSRPSAINLLFGKIGPEKKEIKWALDKLNLEKLDGLFVVHSHFDHAMDAPEVARLTGTIMYGSESTANIGRGWNLSENQIKIFENRIPITIGKFKITPILSRHFEFPDPEIRAQALGGNQEITEPLVPPVAVLDYKMGGAYTLLFEHPKGNFVLQSSAGWLEDSLDSIQTNIVLMGIGGLGSQTTTYQDTYFKEIVDELNARQVYLIHWDAFVGSIRHPIKAPALLSDKMMGNTIGSFEAVARAAAKRPDVRFNLLPQWEPVILLE